MKPANQPLAILGGGVAGLALGGALNKLGIDFELYEANRQVGGLARTLRTEEFKWDLGVHALYSKNPAIMRRFLSFPIDYQHSHRNVKICHVKDGQIYSVGYPFENGLGDLPPEDLNECVEGYRRAQNAEPGAFNHLEDWINRGLGSGFSRVFMTPYNRKIWSVPLGKISMSLVSGKIEPEPYENILRYANGERSEGRGYQARFIYPKEGIQTFCDYLGQQCGNRIHVGMKVTGVRETSTGYSLCFENGEEWGGFGRIVSTIPLKTLIRVLPFNGISVHTSSLHHNDTCFVLVGLKEGARFYRFGDNHWSFYAGDEVFYRLTMMHMFSNQFRKACIAECTMHDEMRRDQDNLAEDVVKDLLRRGILLSTKDVETVSTHYEPFTYPIPTLGLRTVRSKLKDFLGKRGIHLLGRNGNWEYINMDQVLERVDSMASSFLI